MNLRSVLAIITSLVIAAGCAPSSPNNMKISKASPNFETGGLMLFRIHGRGKAALPLLPEADRNLMTAVQKYRSLEYFRVWDDHDEYGVYPVPAGFYRFHGFMWAGVPKVREPLSTRPHNPATDIPVKPFQIRAGEVVCFGTLMVKGVEHDIPITPSNHRVTYEAVDDCNSATAALAEKYPSLQKQIIRRPFEVQVR